MRPQKLDWLNKKHIALKLNEGNTLSMIKELQKAVKEHFGETFETSYLEKIIESAAQRISKVSLIPEYCSYFFKEPVAHYYSDSESEYVQYILSIFEKMEWTKANISEAIKQSNDKFGLKINESGKILRASVCGTFTTPPISDVLFILGNATSLSRLKKSLRQ